MKSITQTATARWAVRALCALGLLLATGAQAQTQAQMFAKPGVIGDSLAQGFYGMTVEKKTQDWAYPVLVTKQARALRPLTYNELKGPYVNLEDFFKGTCGLSCANDSRSGSNGTVYTNPSHVGITGADYTSVIYTSGQCANIFATKTISEFYWKWVPTWWGGYHWPAWRDVVVSDCQTPDRFHQLGLRNTGTQIQAMERLRPTFVFATAAANHVLCSAVNTDPGCIDLNRFNVDFQTTMNRLRAIGSVKGGVLFTIPNVNSLPYLESYSDPYGRASYTGLKAFYRTSVTSPSQVLDANEVNTIINKTAQMNNSIRSYAAYMGFAVADLNVVFQDIRDNGRRVVSSNNKAVLVRANWPMPDQPGMFSLDGVHPNMLGHAIMSNELIKAINTRYGSTLHRCPNTPLGPMTA